MRVVSQPRLWPRILGTTVLSLGVLALFALTYWAFIKTVRGQWLDERALLGVRRFVQDTPALRNELEWFTQIPVAIGIAGLALTIINVFVRRSVLVPAIALGATGAGVVCVRILKELLLERPFTGVSEAYVNSFPSGHSALAIGGMLAALLSMPPRARTWFSFVGALVAAIGGSVTRRRRGFLPCGEFLRADRRRNHRMDGHRPTPHYVPCRAMHRARIRSRRDQRRSDAVT